MKVFCVAEYRFGELNPLSIELLNLANQIKGDGTAEAVVIGKDVSKYAEELAKYADKVWKVEDDSLETTRPTFMLTCCYSLLKRRSPI